MFIDQREQNAIELDIVSIFVKYRKISISLVDEWENVQRNEQHSEQSKYDNKWIYTLRWFLD